MSFEIITHPDEVITLADARTHLNLSTSGSPPSHPDDDYIEDFLIPTARKMVEDYLNKAVGLQTAKVTMTGWLDFVLPFANFASITHIKYDDTNDDEQTLSTDAYWFTSDNKLVMRELPALYDKPDNVRITYQTGYDTGSPANKVIPVNIIHAMKLVLSHLYENRESTTVIDVKELPMGFYTLLTPNREFGV